MAKFLTCVNCGKEFRQGANPRKCCSTECANARRLVGRGLTAWTDAEMGILGKYTGKEPFINVVARVQAYEKAHNIPVRSHECIRVRARLFVGPVSVTEGYCSKEEIKSTLSISYDRLHSWFNLPDPLPVTAKYLHCWKISVEDFRTWARRNPSKLSGISAENLNQLIGDMPFCETVAALPRPMCGAKPVRNITTGQVFPSVCEASRQTYRSFGSVYHAARTGRASLG